MVQYSKMPLGVDAKAYINVGTAETPDWKAMNTIGDVTLNLEKGESDVTTRGARGWEEVVATLKKASIDMDAVWDKTDITYEKLMDSFINDSVAEFMFLDGPRTVVGSQGLKAVMGVFKFTRDEKLKEALKMSVTLKPTYGYIKPSWGKTADNGAWESLTKVVAEEA